MADYLCAMSHASLYPAYSHRHPSTVRLNFSLCRQDNTALVLSNLAKRCDGHILLPPSEDPFPTKTYKAYQEPWGTPPRVGLAMFTLQIQADTASLLRSKVLLGHLDGQCQGGAGYHFSCLPRSEWRLHQLRYCHSS
jgi:hypothetical protein